MFESKTSVLAEPVTNSFGSKLRRWLQLSYTTNRALTLLGVLMVIALGSCAIGLAFDHRIITGMPAWVKPTKFTISIGFYAFTLVWMLSYIKERHPRLVAIISWTMLAGFFVETVILITQVVRGTTSHFNIDTNFDSALFSMMGMFIMVVWFMNLLAAILLMFQKFNNPAFAWSLRLAMIVTLIGMVLGFLMTGHASPSQEAAKAAHQHLQSLGAHSVGVDDGGPGLPFVGWSTVGGDLRISHFLGLHALQLIPLFGWMVMQLDPRRYRNLHRVALVWIGALAYLGLVSLTAWQALRGQSIIAPDALTLGAFAGLVAIAGLLVGGVVLHARRERFTV
jgi:hypothetical protein